MKKLIFPMAIGLLCCTLFTSPASADVTGTIDDVDVVFYTAQGDGSVPVTVVPKFTIANGTNASNTSTFNCQVYYRQPAPYPDYKSYDQDRSKTTAANSAVTYDDIGFVTNLYPQYAYNRQIRVESRLFGLTGGDVTRSDTKTIP